MNVVDPSDPDPLQQYLDSRTGSSSGKDPKPGYLTLTKTGKSVCLKYTSEKSKAAPIDQLISHLFHELMKEPSLPHNANIIFKTIAQLKESQEIKRNKKLNQFNAIQKIFYKLFTKNAKKLVQQTLLSPSKENLTLIEQHPKLLKAFNQEQQKNWIEHSKRTQETLKYADTEVQISKINEKLDNLYYANPNAQLEWIIKHPTMVTSLLNSNIPDEKEKNLRFFNEIFMNNPKLLQYLHYEDQIKVVLHNSKLVKYLSLEAQTCINETLEYLHLAAPQAKLEFLKNHPDQITPLLNSNDPRKREQTLRFVNDILISNPKYLRYLKYKDQIKLVLFNSVFVRHLSSEAQILFNTCNDNFQKLTSRFPQSAKDPDLKMYYFNAHFKILAHQNDWIKEAHKQNKPLYIRNLPGEPKHLAIQINPNGQTLIHLNKNLKQPFGRVANHNENIVGKGSFKKVRMAVDFQNGNLYAISKQIVNRSNYTSAMAEVALLQQYTNSDRIVKMQYSLLNIKNKKLEHKLIIQQTLYDGDLENKLKLNLPLENKHLIAKDLLSGVAEIHHKNQAHRDIKPANIFVKQEGTQLRGYIGDLGLLAAHNETRHSGTPAYCAPEYLASWPGIVPYSTKQLPAPDSQKSDAYALGLTLYELYTSQHELPIFKLPQNRTAEIIELTYQNCLGTIQDQLRQALVPEKIQDIIMGLLKVNPKERLTVIEALEQFNMYNPLSILL